VEESPVQQLLSAIDRLDLEAAVALMTSDCRLLSVDGRRAHGVTQVRDLLADFFSGLRSTSHKVVAEWHQAETWMAELEAEYELRNWLRIDGVPRALFLRRTGEGITDARFYGAHERPIMEDGGDPEMMRLGGRWIPPL
jgi:hypothetical protein